MRIINGANAVTNPLAFSPNGETLAGIDADGFVHLWDFGGHAPLVGRSRNDSTVAFSPDGRYLVSAGADQWLNVWDLAEHKLIYAIEPENHQIRSLAFVGPGVVLFGICDRTTRLARPATMFLFDLATGRTRRFSFDVVNGVYLVAGLPDRRVAAWITDTKVLRLQDITRPPGKAVVLKEECRALALSADGRRLAVTSKWDILVFDIDRSWPATPRTIGRHQGLVSSLAFGPDSSVLYSGGWDGMARVWDLDRELERRAYSWPIGQRVISVTASQDGLRAAAAGDAGKIAVWDLT